LRHRNFSLLPINRNGDFTVSSLQKKRAYIFAARRPAWPGSTVILAELPVLWRFAVADLIISFS
jgi:hypothetical protein